MSAWLALPRPPTTYPIQDDYGGSWRQGVDRAMASDSGVDRDDEWRPGDHFGQVITSGRGGIIAGRRGKQCKSRRAEAPQRFLRLWPG
jgi:hypothetical protein